MNGKSAAGRRLCAKRLWWVYEALWNAGTAGKGAFQAHVQARELPVSEGFGKQALCLRPSEREAAAKIYCEQALQGMELSVDEVKLTQLPSGQARVEVYLTCQDEKQALEVRI